MHATTKPIRMKATQTALRIMAVRGS
jgi:hypothetical protein